MNSFRLQWNINIKEKIILGDLKKFMSSQKIGQKGYTLNEAQYAKDP